MDKFTRVYSIILAVIVVVALVVVFYERPAVSRLNTLLEADPAVSAYPYRFRVLELKEGVATLGTPRSADFPASRALGILFPELRDEMPDSPAMLDAQKELARVQAIAKRTVEASEDVDRVTWELDEKWLRNAGIDPDQL
jgi:hypothetical protein